MSTCRAPALGLALALAGVPVVGVPADAAVDDAVVGVVAAATASPDVGDPASADVPGGSAAEQATSGDPAAGDPAAGDPTAGDPAAGDPAAGDPGAEAPVSEDPAMPGAPDEVPQDAPAGEDPGAGAAATEPGGVLADGYQDDGFDRPFWWASDGLHLREPMPANGYVNINVPGASNVSADTQRELIGSTLVPWSAFGLGPGMCVTWTEANGYGYHFGEDNSGRGGTDERGWQYCVPGVVDPDGPSEPTDPGESTDPSEPTDPVEPTDPDAPTGPAEPVAPGPDQPAGQVEAHGTGGSSAAPEAPATASTSGGTAADRTVAVRDLAVTGSPAVPLAAAAGLAVVAGAVLTAVRRRGHR